MFAAAAREVVFSNPEVVRRVNEQFIPVALKAGLVNNPPRGIEGELYADINRTKPAPQGICTMNSGGKVLSWALSFDDDDSIETFLDHVLDRYKQSPDAPQSVIAQRYMKFPSRQMPDVSDNNRRMDVPNMHTDLETCPARPITDNDTLVGTIIGRALDEDGNPLTDTVHQENYMEARLELDPHTQRQLIHAACAAAGEQFELPQHMIETLVGSAYLGQLDVNPLSDRPETENTARWWEFHGQQVDTEDSSTIRIRIEGSSNAAARHAPSGTRFDGRIWEHRVTLNWYGFIDLHGDRATKLVMLAAGDERLRWGNRNLTETTEADVEHLMAGHPIDFDGDVRYGLIAEANTSTAVNPNR